jgi:ribosome-binding factor A
MTSMVRHEQSPGPSVRLLRVGEQVRHILAEILQRGDVHDNVLASHMVSVTEVRMSPDLKIATVFVKPLLGKDEADVLTALRQNTAYLQREVAKRIKMKFAAKLRFIGDESFEEGSHIDALLRSPQVARDLDEKGDDEDGLDGATAPLRPLWRRSRRSGPCGAGRAAQALVAPVAPLRPLWRRSRDGRAGPRSPTIWPPRPNR